jgi:hypothetical protein
MGAMATRAEFDAWSAYVCVNIDDDVGFEVHEVNQFDFAANPDQDEISGATEEQSAIIREWLAYAGWEGFCSENVPETIDTRIARLSDQLGALEGAAQGSDEETEYLRLYELYDVAIRERGGVS